jgi:hypothetical protein
VGQLKDYSEKKGHTSSGGTGMWGIRDCRLLVERAPVMESLLLSMSH